MPVEGALRQDEEVACQRVVISLRFIEVNCNRQRVLMLRIASDQPTFLPWAGFWHKALAVDVLIYSVGVPVSYGRRDHYHNRVKLAGSWLTLPIQGATDGVAFKDIRFDPRALPKIVRSLRTVFGKKFPHRSRVQAVIDEIESWDGAHNLLVDFNAHMISTIAKQIDEIDHYTWWDAQVPDQTLSKTERLISRVRRVTQEPVAYHMGRGALAYMDVELMKKSGIRVFLQTLSPAVRDETILQLAATSADALAALESIGSWEEVA
jgi:hypothetical protein